MKGLVFLLIACSVSALPAQEGRGDLRFVFYNVENLFDPFDDSLRQDDEFLPGGMRHWTWERFLEKERRIYKVLASIGGWKPPELIGLCEVENRFVLNWLTRGTPLLKYNYRVIHRDSPDERGIDVALLYLPACFRPLEYSWIPVSQIRDPTRDLLYVRGRVMNRDTIHLVICHWPSRWEGYLESLPDRLEAARVVRRLVDSIGQSGNAARILIAGDLNDEASDPGLSAVLRVQIPEIPGSFRVDAFSGGTCPYCACACLCDTCIYDTRMPGRAQEDVKGTLKYRGRWYEFDQILVNGTFLKDTNLYVKPGGKRIYAPGFLLEQDPGIPGIRPFRTYNGFTYRAGYSDHLPVYIDLWRRQ